MRNKKAQERGKQAKGKLKSNGKTRQTKDAEKSKDKFRQEKNTGKTKDRFRQGKNTETTKDRFHQVKNIEKTKDKARQVKNEEKKVKAANLNHIDNEIIWDTIIIGAGAAGMTAAITCGRQGQKVLLLERQSQMGRKILVTGNGKCNLTNFDQKDEYYRSDCPEKNRKILTAFGQKEAMEFFHSLGIYTKDRNGYVYPYSEQAASVREAFETEILSNSNITFLPETEVYDLWKEKEKFHVAAKILTDGETVSPKEQQYTCNSLLITTGGLAGPKFGCDGSGYTFARKFGHEIIKPLPALTALKSSAPFLKKISGVRNQATITLEIDGTVVGQETGELQWTDYGISGVAIFQLSRFAITALEEHRKVSLYFDFMPELSMEEKYNLFETLAEHNERKTVLSFVKGLFPAKLCPVILREAGVEENRCIGSLQEEDWNALVGTVSHFSLRINGYMGYEKAQVTRGGVSLAELTDSLESVLQPGLFFAGEVTDVDGTCGGYNLQWAFSSGTVAAGAIIKRNQGKSGVSRREFPVTKKKEQQTLSERNQNK